MDGRVILITGCSSGIGLDAAWGLRARGWRVFASCRKPADRDRLRAEGFDSPLIDYDRPETLRDGLAEMLQATGGRIDALFNNGAFAVPGRVEDIPRGAMEAIFSTNLFGVHELTCAVIPHMRAQGHGRILQCSSVLGYVAAEWRGAYVATKFALEGLTDTLRLEMAGTGIDVVLIEPGPIESRFRANAIPQFEKWVDWRASAAAPLYEAAMGKLYGRGGPGRFQLPPSAVTDVLVRALDAPRPRARYRVTVPAKGAAWARRLLPTRLLDRVSRAGS
ncbi:SDR family NAD(P)-dependent oxidoreductase [Wenxinia saemankumensis]|uniref:Short-chain dehydrogenase n=1 Tax=Wenxinia saemankumensis TaxID=1447782 RepID=A0A1M6C4R8_9RHOB|nr:SDR family NAD(P)-dependent oxidoreductase [Wenxinia saemankumensis]SHI56020.1 Short-chain dehydrogenase [Wenxinia saemankumensis]